MVAARIVWRMRGEVVRLASSSQVRAYIAAVCVTVGFPACLVAGATAAVRNERDVEPGVVCRSLTDPADALQDPVTRRAERGQIQRDWIAASADSGRQAREALAKAAEMLAGNIPGRRRTRSWPLPGLRSVRGGPACHTPRRPGALRLLPSQWIREA